MHEMAISEGILGIIEDQGRRQDFGRVKRVWLEIGPLAGIETEALRFTFDVVAKGTIADSAVLEIIATEARAWCLLCETSVAIENRWDACPRCGGHQLQTTSGNEMRIKELEVE